MNLSSHFTLSELTTSSHADIPNEPGPAEIKALRLLCANVLEPLRSILGVSIKVNSGYRSTALNTAIKGSKTSQHKKGEAADIVPLAIDPEVAMRKLYLAVKEKRLEVDQAIIYASGFLHVSYTVAKPNRGEFLRSAADSGAGGPYTPYVSG